MTLRDLKSCWNFQWGYLHRRKRPSLYHVYNIYIYTHTYIYIYVYTHIDMNCITATPPNSAVFVRLMETYECLKSVKWSQMSVIESSEYSKTSRCTTCYSNRFQPFGISPFPAQAFHRHFSFHGQVRWSLQVSTLGFHLLSWSTGQLQVLCCLQAVS